VTPALEVIGLGHSFGKRPILRDVTFAIPASGFTMLLGLNGAGKTTLISLLSRLYHARQGEILVFGRSLRRQPLRGLAAMGLVFQEPTLDLDLTVRDNLLYHGALHGLSRREAAERGHAQLERLGLGGRMDDRARTLSNGERRRVEIARALSHGPKLLLLDEPTVGLDLAARAAILAHVRGLCRADGVSVLWTTHLMEEVADSDDVVMLDRGAVSRIGKAAAIRQDLGAASVGDALRRLTVAA
jgi:ABC-2 type transport system ATP-binding protein